MRRKEMTAWMLAIACTLPLGAGLTKGSAMSVYAGEETEAVISQTMPDSPENEGEDPVPENEENAGENAAGDVAYGIRLSCTSGGTVTVNGTDPSGASQLDAGASVTIKATSVEGFTLRSLSVDTAYTTDAPGTISFSMPEKNVTVSAVFDPIECVKVTAQKEVLDTGTNGIAYKKIPVQGATYNLVADDEVYLDGTLVYTKGEVIETLTTGEDGCVTSTKPFTGEAHLVNTGVKEADLSVDAGDVPIAFSNGIGEAAYTYAAKKTNLTVFMTDSVQDGQTVTLRCTKDVSIPGGETLAAGTVLGCVTVADQKAVFTDLPSASYGSLPMYEVELEPSPGTYKIKETTPVTEEDADGLFATIHTKRQETRIFVTDLVGNPIEGASMALYAQDKEEALFVFSSGKTAYLADRLTPGTYQIRTLSTAPGYVYANDDGTVSFTIEDTDRTKEISLQEKKNTVSLMVADKEDGAKTKDASLQIYRIGNDRNRTLCTNFGEQGLLPFFVQLRALPKGDYVAVEATTPEGYQKAEEKHFSIDEKTEDYIITLESYRTYGHIDLTLLSSVNRKPLPGGEYVIRDNGKVVAKMTTDGNGKSTSVDLPIGTYADGRYLGEKTYQLFEAKAPDGYEKDEKGYDITFGYLNSNIPRVAISATIPNTAVVEEIPEMVTVRRKVSSGTRTVSGTSKTTLAGNANTSDAGHLPFTAGIMALSGICGGICNVFRKKRRSI